MKLPKEVLDVVGNNNTIRMFIIVKDECHEMRLPFDAWKFLYDYQEQTNKAFNDILRESLVEYFNKRMDGKSV